MIDNIAYLIAGMAIGYALVQVALAIIRGR